MFRQYGSEEELLGCKQQEKAIAFMSSLWEVGWQLLDRGFCARECLVIRCDQEGFYVKIWPDNQDESVCAY